MRVVVPGLLASGVVAQLADGDDALRVGLRVLVREMHRIAELGYSDEELELAKTKWRSTFEAQLREGRAGGGGRAAGSIAAECVESFTRGVPLGGPEAEARLRSRCWRPSAATKSARTRRRTQCRAPLRRRRALLVLTLQRLRGNARAPPPATRSETQRSVGSSMRRWGSCATRQPLARAHRTQPRGAPPRRVELPPQRGRVASRRRVADGGADAFEELLFDNGMRVVLRLWAPGTLSMQGFALGGSTELGEADDVAFSMLSNVCADSGLGGLDGPELAELESVSKARVNTQRHATEDSAARARRKLQLLLKMLHLRLTVGSAALLPAFEKAVQRSRALLEHAQADPESQLMDRAREGAPARTSCTCR